MREIHGQPLREYAGFCRRCGREHRVSNDVTLAHAELATLFDELAGGAADPVRTALAATGGKMVGILVGQQADGGTRTLRAFSGDLGGRQAFPGWAPSAMVRADTADLERETLAELARIEAETAACAFPAARERYRALAAQPGVARAALAEAHRDYRAREQVFLRLRTARRATSARLMAAMFDAARLTNGRGERLPLREVFVGTGIPSGTTECVVPRLLEAANAAGLRPVALAEAWWGPPLNGRKHGELQAPCVNKCEPILGHLLCGWSAGDPPCR